ncbi:receptor-like protein 12 [Raphanus sativus]|nr:receptor-like protein 12 [Raphanus sativus]
MLCGNIPISVTNLTKLSYFNIHSNNFTSTLPSNMSGLHNLKVFDIGENSFFGPFPDSLFKIPSLLWVDLGKNHFTGPIQFVKNTSSLSSELFHLDLSHNAFSGLIPESISDFFSFEQLVLSHNNFSGPIPCSISKLVNLDWLDLSNNNLEGEVPSCLWRLRTLMHMDLSSNHFRGSFPHWICKLKELSLLDLSNNLFNGSIPPCLRNSIGYLTDMILRNNSFSGTLPDIFSKATKLQMIDVGRNHLEGSLPKSLIHCKALKLLNVEYNRIKDKFPYWLGSLPSLNVLSLRSNEFYGTMYKRNVFIGFHSLCVIDLSHNDLSGTLPPSYFSNWLGITKIYNFSEMPKSKQLMFGSRYDFRSMGMVNKGVELRYEKIRKDFGAINLAGNRICGKIPESIGFLKELRLLNLSGNTFTEDIPLALANLTNLETLDLSSNKLSGQIPQDLGKLSFLSYMNFSHNLLRGPVPRGTQFQSQNCSSFSDNPGLYGLEDICHEAHVPYPPEESPEAEEHMFSWVVAAIAYGPGVLCGLVIGHIFASHNQEWFTERFGRRKLRVTTSAR